ncbi:fumarylacetoacetate hydrolase family protein [Sphingomonas sp.]|uniref:fumarylacetoacetate hydrolase family protein n=1 Tax=Sphingomonas sp. TaxID=28214 RepID=UPI003D6D514A
MKRALILYDGVPTWGDVRADDAQILIPGGGVVAFDDAAWLPPVTAGATIFALGLNYADHVKELGFKSTEAPLIFLKGPNTLTGHARSTPRPPDANQMHPECELVAVIGRPARRVHPGAALDHVAGYTIACDYAVREYLENYYRPNLRVKNRDATTPLGPWLVDAADLPDPQTLRMTTHVNGTLVQQGSTADMVLGVADLIAYLSETMTLLPGDMILTGTPKGVHFCAVGDHVECEIEGIGRLANHLTAAVP